MNIAIRYYTRSGNTQKLAEAIAEAISAEAESISVPLTEKADILFLGCSYYAFDMDEAVKQFLLTNKDDIGRIVCFGTSAMMKSMKKPLGKIAETAGLAVDDAEFHCKGSFGPMHKGKPDAKDMEKAADWAAGIIKERG